MAEQRKKPSPREAAYLTLLAFDEEREAYFSRLMRREAKKAGGFAGRELSLFKELCLGTLSRRITLDHVIAAYSDTPPQRLRPQIRWILRLGVYQLLFMPQIPGRAAVNESVKLCAIRGFSGLKGYVNAVLRAVERGGKEPVIEEGASEGRLFHVRYSCPEWLAEQLLSEYGAERAKLILKAGLDKPPLTARLTDSEEEKREQLLFAWRKQGVEAAPHPWVKGAYLLTGVSGIRELPGYAEGRFILQDAASMLPVLAAGLKGGEHILDVCASPGGKSLYAAQLLTTGDIRAGDISEAKVSRMQENICRLKLEKKITPLVRDASIPHPEEWERYDVLLADLPCSGLGVLARKPDRKYRLKKEEIPRLAELQQRILSASLPCLKPGGILVYSTCTISRQENEEQARWLLQEMGMKPVNLAERLPAGLFAADKPQYELQLFPSALSDGFYLAAFEKAVSQADANAMLA